MVLIYKWPPQLKRRDLQFTVEQPVNSSRSLLTGARFMSRHARKRRLAYMDVSVHNDHGYGIMEALKNVLDGGVNLIRLDYRMPTDVRAPRGSDQSWDVPWDVPWENITGTPETGTNAMRFENLVPNKLCARAGEFVRYGAGTRQLLTDLTATATGTGRAELVSQFDETGTKPVELGAEETGIFEATELPEIPWTWASEATVTWTLREVLAGEITSATEIAPWGH